MVHFPLPCLITGWYPSFRYMFAPEPLKRYLKVYPGDDWVRIWWLGVIRVVLLKLLGMSINPLRYLYMICMYSIPLIWLVYANPSVLHFHLPLFKGETGLQKCFFLHYLPRCLVRIIQMYRSISLRSISHGLLSGWSAHWGYKWSSKVWGSIDNYLMVGWWLGCTVAPRSSWQCVFGQVRESRSQWTSEGMNMFGVNQVEQYMGVSYHRKPPALSISQNHQNQMGVHGYVSFPGDRYCN